jgi:hypothetical protein
VLQHSDQNKHAASASDPQKPNSNHGDKRQSPSHGSRKSHQDRLLGQSIDIQVDGETYTIDAAAEKRLVWKFDLRILPILAVMYLFNALDKSNLGNAKTAGLEKDLGMKGTNQYNTILSIFFVPYVLTAPFLAILGKKYGPSRVLPAMMVTFGTMTLLVVTVKNFAGLFVLRWFLGMAESESRTETAQLQGSPANNAMFERRLLSSGNLLPNAILPSR